MKCKNNDHGDPADKKQDDTIDRQHSEQSENKCKESKQYREYELVTAQYT